MRKHILFSSGVSQETCLIAKCFDVANSKYLHKVYISNKNNIESFLWDIEETVKIWIYQISFDTLDCKRQKFVSIHSSMKRRVSETFRSYMLTIS